MKFPVAFGYDFSYRCVMDTTFPKHPDLAREVAAFLTAKGMRPTRFGKLAVGDPSLIASLIAGRELRSETIAAIRRFMATEEPRQKIRAAA